MPAQIAKFRDIPTVGRKRTHKFQLELIDAIEPGYAIKYTGTAREPLTQSVYDSIRATACRISRKKGGIFSTEKLENAVIVYRES